MKFIEQEGGTWCFVAAVANLMIYLGKPVKDLEVAKDIARCRHGSTICPQDVVQYFGASLTKTDDHEEVFKKGGILSIRHPIFNLHAVAVFPENGYLTLVNSYLGPLVAKGIEPNEISKFLPPHHLRRHWSLGT